MAGFPNPNQVPGSPYGYPPTPTAPFLGPIELPYISGPTRDVSAQRMPYAPLLVSMGSPASSSSSGSGSGSGSIGVSSRGSGHGPASSSTRRSSRHGQSIPQPITSASASGTSASADLYGLATPPTSPTHSLNLLLRTSATGFAALIYNALFPPTFTGPNTIFHPAVPSLSMSDLYQPATDPPVARLSATIQYSAHPQSRSAQFLWAVSIRPSRQGAPVMVYDVLVGLYSSLATPVGEQELAAFSKEWIESAKVERSNRIRGGSAVNAFVRSDFLQGCVYFAGMTMGQNGGMVIKLLPRLN